MCTPPCGFAAFVHRLRAREKVDDERNICGLLTPAWTADAYVGLLHSWGSTNSPNDRFCFVIIFHTRSLRVHFWRFLNARLFECVVIVWKGRPHRTTCLECGSSLLIFRRAHEMCDVFLCVRKPLGHVLEKTNKIQ